MADDLLCVRHLAVGFCLSNVSIAGLPFTPGSGSASAKSGATVNVRSAGVKRSPVRRPICLQHRRPRRARADRVPFL